MGLCKKSRFGYGLVKKKWESIQTAVDGFSFNHHFGKNKQNLFGIGQTRMDIREQIATKARPPPIPYQLLESARQFMMDEQSNSSGSGGTDGDGDRGSNRIDSSGGSVNGNTTGNSNGNSSGGSGASVTGTDNIQKRPIEFVHGDDDCCSSLPSKKKRRLKPRSESRKQSFFEDKICPICNEQHLLVDCETAKANGLVIAYDPTQDQYKDDGAPDTEGDDEQRRYRKGYRNSFHKGREVKGIQNRLRVVDVNKLNNGERNTAIISNIRQVANRKKVVLSQRNKLYLGTFAARFPQLPDIAVEQALAAGAFHCASMFDLCNPTTPIANSLVSFDSITTIVPSRTASKHHVNSIAAHKIIRNGRSMQNAKKIYIGADHGGGVLVKMAFFWDVQEKKVKMLNLDFDKAGHDAKGGGAAIKSSVRKYIYDDSVDIKFAGGSSDSGGGFTKEAMKKALLDVDLADVNKYIHVNCTEHNDQTALRCAATKAYGTGNIDNRNVLQLVHAFSDFQKAHESTAQFKERMRSEFLFVRGIEPPKEFLKLMQEPILTRWMTVGEAVQFQNSYIDVTASLCKSTMKMRSIKANSQLGKTASNFLSLANEPEITADLAFLADFDRVFFKEHMEFNRSIDKNIGCSGFIPHHHLVRYYIKCAELDDLAKELEHGSTGAWPINPKLKSFWEKIRMEQTKNSLKRAKIFIEEYKVSIHKHNSQFVSAELLFLACFGEHNTSELVAKMLCDGDFGDFNDSSEPTDHIFVSPFHQRQIDLTLFRKFLGERCGGVTEEARTTENFFLLEHTIRTIAHGSALWNGDPAMEPHRLSYLENFAALPSTSVWVERSVKKAKLCQKTGNGERNVTAYCIAGDDINEKCTTQSVASDYAGRMAKQRKKLQQKRGTQARLEIDYGEEDITRGPAMTKNILEHALKLEKDILTITEQIGEKAYAEFYHKTLDMLTKLPLQGSFARYKEQLESLVASRSKTHVPSAREKVRGVDETAWAKGEIPFGELLMAQNTEQLKAECIARGIAVSENGKPIGWRRMKDAIKAQNREEWIAANPGKTAPLSIDKHFRQRSCTSTVEFIRKRR